VQDRVHRLGQTKQVTVYRMVASNTIDDALLAMQSKKAKLTHALLAADGIVADGDGDGDGAATGSDEGAAAESVTPSAVAELLQAALAMRTTPAASVCDAALPRCSGGD
jgi:hypothetical protein